MSTVYRSRHRSSSSYRPVRVRAREFWHQNPAITGKPGGSAVVLALGALAVVDGILFTLIGLR